MEPTKIDMLVTYGTRMTPEEAVAERDTLRALIMHPRYPEEYVRSLRLDTDAIKHQMDDVLFMRAMVAALDDWLEHGEVAIWRHDPLVAAEEAAASYPDDVHALPPPIAQYWTFDEDLIMKMLMIGVDGNIDATTPVLTRVLACVVVDADEFATRMGLERTLFSERYVVIGFVTPADEATAGKRYVTMNLWRPAVLVGPHLAKRNVPDIMTKMFASMLDFMRSRVVDRVDAVFDRPARRRYHRQYHREPPTVRVVTLRRPKVERDAEHEPDARDWTCRWLVRPHWRKQWYPSAQEHRAKLIAAYVKGPADKPFREKVKVYNIAR